MDGFIMAITLFAALVGIIVALRAEDRQVERFADAPRRLPLPGPRDLHAVTGATLGRAHVPSWG